MNAHHNSTGEQGSLLALLETRAARQDAAVLDVFRGHPPHALTPSEAHELYARRLAAAGASEPPLTSVRRAMTNLTRDGLLVRTRLKKRGPYGRPEHVWRLA